MLGLQTEASNLMLTPYPPRMKGGGRARNDHLTQAPQGPWELGWGRGDAGGGRCAARTPRGAPPLVRMRPQAMPAMLQGRAPPPPGGAEQPVEGPTVDLAYSSLPSLLGPPTHIASREATRINPPAMLGTRRPPPPKGGGAVVQRPRVQANRHEACHS